MKNSKVATILTMTLVILATTSFSLYAYRYNAKKHSHCEKNLSNWEAQHFYVDPKMIYMAPNGIFLNFEGRCFPINTLCSDVNGIFVPSQEMSREFIWCAHCLSWKQQGNLCSH